MEQLTTYSWSSIGQEFLDSKEFFGIWSCACPFWGTPQNSFIDVQLTDPSNKQIQINIYEQSIDEFNLLRE